MTRVTPRLAVGCRADLEDLRGRVVEAATAAGFAAVEVTRLTTAVSEIARNALVHGGGGEATVARLRRGDRVGLRVVVDDDGPGIANVAEAFRDGFTTHPSSMGMGLGGARRLVDHLEVASRPGEGTRVTLLAWRRRQVGDDE